VPNFIGTRGQINRFFRKNHNRLALRRGLRKGTEYGAWEPESGENEGNPAVVGQAGGRRQLDWRMGRGYHAVVFVAVFGIADNFSP
jgi:hypothetical protein